MVAAMSTLRPMGSIDWVLREASAALGPLLPAIGAAAPPEVVLFTIGLVVTPCFLATMALGPLVPPGSHFLELLVNIHAWSFITLQLPEAIRRVLSTQASPLARSRWWSRAGWS
jgi:hypothetical protein